MDFTLVPSADRANVVHRNLKGCRGSYFEVLFAFVVGLVSSSRKEFVSGLHKTFFFILLTLRRVRMIAETVLSRKFEPISTRVERWSLLIRLPCAYFIHGLIYVKTLCKDSRQHNVMFYDFYSVFGFYLRLKISILKRHTNSYIQPPISSKKSSNANIMLGFLCNYYLQLQYRNSLMHVYVRLANFTPSLAFEIEKNPTQKQRELVKGLQRISYKRGSMMTFELVTSSCIRPIEIFL